MMAARRAPYLLLLAALLAGPALAQTRPIPEEARRGYIQHVQEMIVTLDGNSMRLAPGSTVRDQKNLIIVPAAMPRQGAWVDFIVDSDGQISRVWLLTPEEQAQPRNQSGR